MRRFAIVAAVVAACTFSSGARADHDPVLVDRARTGALLDDAIEDLARLEGKTEGKGKGRGKGDCRHLDQDLASVQQKLKHLREVIQRAPSARELITVGLVADGEGVILHAGPHGAARPPAPPPVAPAAPPIVIMPVPDFRALQGALKSESFGDSKLRVLDEAARHGWFSTDQVVEVLGQFEFGDDKLKALKILAPRLVDRENAFRIFQAFEFEGDKQKAKAILSTATH